MQACLLEGLDQCTGIGAQRVGQDETGQQFVFIGQIDGQPLSGILFLRQFEPACTADAVMLALNYSLHAVADDGVTSLAASGTPSASGLLRNARAMGCSE